MTDEKNQYNFSFLEPLRRYVPLAVWVIIVLTLLLIPLKIIGYGYIPGDDALRAAGKAVSGKTWQQVLILNDVYKIDHEYGWSLLLGKIHTAFNADAETIVIFSVVSLFVLAGLVTLPWLRYPETWLMTLVIGMITAMVPARLLLGRPYIITIAALLSLLLLWRRYGSAPPKDWMIALMTGLITASVYFHGTWYLWVLPVAAFFLAAQFRWGLTLAGCWVAGVFLGSLLTGHLIDYPLQAVKVALLATGMHLTQRTLASELQPDGGDLNTLYFLGGLLLLRRLATERHAVLARPGFLAGLPGLDARFQGRPFLGRLGLAGVDGAAGLRPAIAAGVAAGAGFIPAAGTRVRRGVDHFSVHHRRYRQPLDLQSDRAISHRRQSRPGRLAAG